MAMAYNDGVITLLPKALEPAEKDGSIGQIFVFSIMEEGRGNDVGEISLRCGESPDLYYLGHVGYHVNEGYRGHGYAYRACLLIKPLMRALGMRSAVITCDTDNMGSRRTCEKLGCVLERVVSVPWRFREKYVMSGEKCRYIFYSG